MVFYLFFSLLTLLSPPPPHDIPLGVFSLNFEEEQIQMDIKLEVADLKKAIAAKYNKKDSDQLVGQYILENTDWYVNETLLKPEICSTNKEEDHYFIKMNFPKPTAPLVNMTIRNECLLHEIDNHSNIIYIQQNGQRRGFRLNKDRISTSFDFM